MAASRLARLSVVLLLPVGAWKTTEDTPWQIADSPPPWDAHTGSIAVSMSDDSVLLIAGQKGRHGGALFDCFNCTNEVWNFQLSTETWTDLSAGVPWDPRWGHSAVVQEDDTVWMLFGCCEKGKPTVMLRDVWTYNPAQGVPWTKMETQPPFEGIQATSVAIRGDELWVVGGWSQYRGTLSQVAVMSMKTLEWTVKSKHGEAPWRHRADHATAISPDGKWLYVYAGQHRDERTQHWFRLEDTWRVSLPDARATDWQRLPDLQGARSSVPVLILPTGFLLALGGHYVPGDEELKVKQEDLEGMKDHHENNEFKVYNDVLALDLRGDNSLSGWRVVEEHAPWPARDDCAASVSRKGDVLLFGGGTLYGGGGYLHDTWRMPDASTSYGLTEAASQDKIHGGEL